SSKPESTTTTHSFSAFDIVAGELSETFVVLAFVVLVALFSRANVRDLWLPTSARVLLRDILIGAAACLTALPPPHMTLNMLMSLFFPRLTVSAHPFIMEVKESHSYSLLMWMGFTTVVLAPLCEELVFRLMLQGWLERWEDDRLGWRRTAVELSAIE